MKSLEPHTNVTSEGFKLNRLYLRLWHAGFRWLYLIDAIFMFTIMVLVNLIRFGTDWPEKMEMWIGIVVATFIFQFVFWILHCFIYNFVLSICMAILLISLPDAFPFSFGMISDISFPISFCEVMFSNFIDSETNWDISSSELHHSCIYFWELYF